MKQDQIWQEFRSLPPELQQQVMDFIVFLRTRQAPLTVLKSAKRGKLKDEPFVGMWRKRNDFADSTAWVREARRREWQRTRTQDS